MLGLGLALSIGKRVLGDAIDSLLSALRGRATYYENGSASKSTIKAIDDADILDKASILLTPTATSDARVHSVKTYTGDEIATDGNFELTNNQNASTTGTYWTTSAGWEIINGIAVADGSVSGNNYLISTGTDSVVGHTYKVIFTVSDYVTGNVRVRAGQFSSSNVNDNGTYTQYQVATSTESVRVQGSSSFEGKVDNISIIDVSSDFDFDRASSATRINSDGLVQDMQSITDPELVTNGDFEELGSELVTNGTFDTDSDWFTLGDWAISGGLANCNGSSIMYTNASIIANKTYKVTYTVSGFVSGGVKIKINGSPDTDGLVRTANGTYTEYITSSSSVNGNFSFAAVVSFIGSIDNVSVQQVDPNDRWSLGTGWSVGDGIVEANNTSTFIEQSGLIEASKLYRLTFQARLKSGTNGTINAYIGGSNNKQFTISDTNWQSFTYINTRGGSTSTSIYFNNNGTELELDNISLKDITFSEEVDLARINYDSNGDNGHILLEPTSTNLVTYSEDFSDSSWFKGNTTVIANQEVSPSGIQDADKVTFLAVPNANIQLTSAITTTIGEDYTYSIWAKADANVNNVNFGGGIGGDVALAITDNWQRFTVTFTATSTSTITTLVTRDSVLANIYIWGAQIEQLPYATSYIPNHGTAVGVTRAAETLTGSGNSTLINSTEGVLYAEIAALADDGTNRTIALNKDTNDRIQMYFNTSTNGLSIFYKAQSGATSFIMNETLTDATSFNKIAFKWKANDFALWVNGVETDTVSSGVTPTANSLNALEFQLFNNAGPFYGKCKALAVFNEALSDTELTNLTS